MSNKMNVCVIIPANNKENIIGSVVLSARKYSDHLIVIDNGQSDNTYESAKLAGAEVITLKKNESIADAVESSFARARETSDNAVIIDCGEDDFSSGITASETSAVFGSDDSVSGSRVTTNNYSEKQELSALSGILRFISYKHPLLCFGLPGIIFTAAGLWLAVRAFDIILRTGVLATNTTLGAVTILMSGLMLVSAALILYALSQARNKFVLRHSYE